MLSFTRRQLLTALLLAPLAMVRVPVQRSDAGRPGPIPRERGLHVPMRVPLFVDVALPRRVYLPLLANFCENDGVCYWEELPPGDIPW